MEMVEEICKHCKHCLSCFCGDEFKDCKLKKSPSVEERANKHYPIYGEGYADNDTKNAQFHAYVKGATEQKAIDDKLYEDIIANECTASYESGLEQGRRDIIEKCVIFDKLGRPIRTVEELAKAMEE